MELKNVKTKESFNTIVDQSCKCGNHDVVRYTIILDDNTVWYQCSKCYAFNRSRRIEEALRLLLDLLDLLD